MQELNSCRKLVVKSATEDHFTVSGYASVFGIPDSHNDIMIKGAFKTITSLQNIKFLWQHDATTPIGVLTLCREDEYGLYIESVINGSTQKGREAIALIKQGAISGLSVGFVVKEANYNIHGKREISLVDLWEVSLVTFPANNGAQVNHSKSILPIKELDLAINRAAKVLDKLFLFNKNNLN